MGGNRYGDFLVIMQLKARVAQRRFGESLRVGIGAAMGTVLLMFGCREGQRNRNTQQFCPFSFLNSHIVRSIEDC